MSQLLDKGFSTRAYVKINDVTWLAEPKRVAGEWVWVLLKIKEPRVWYWLKIVDPKTLTVTDEQILEAWDMFKWYSL